MICDADDRLGRHGIDDFKSHPFFRGIEWDTLRLQKPPYIPEFTSDADTRNFEPYEPEDDGIGKHVCTCTCTAISIMVLSHTCTVEDKIKFPFFRFVSFDDRATEIKRPRVVGTLVQRLFHETIDERLNDDSERLNDSTL